MRQIRQTLEEGSFYPHLCMEQPNSIGQPDECKDPHLEG
jgi:hypothetical protein